MSGFLRAATSLVAGAAVAQGISVLSSLWIARLYPVSEMGSYGAFLAGTTLIVTVASLRYEQAIVVASSDHEAGEIFWLANMLSLGVGVIAMALVFVGGDVLASVLPRGSLTTPVIFGATFTLFGVNQILQVVATRERAFGILATSRVLAALVTAVLQIAIAYVGRVTASSLVYSYIVGIVMQSLLLLVLCSPRWIFEAPSGMTPGSVLVIMKKQRNFPLFAMPSGFVSSFGTQGLTLWLTAMFPRSTVGLYVIMNRTLSAPCALIAQAVSPATYGRLAQRKGASEFAAASFIGSLMLALPFAALLMVVAPSVFGFLYGPAYFEAGQMARLAVPGYVLMFSALPLTQAFFAFERQQAGLLWSMAFVVGTAAAIFIGLQAASFSIVLVLYSILSVGMYTSVAWMAITWGDEAHRGVAYALKAGVRQVVGIVRSGAFVSALLGLGKRA
jgi:O-antigen/teichoic acid export membrane protein